MYRTVTLIYVKTGFSKDDECLSCLNEDNRKGKSFAFHVVVCAIRNIIVLIKQMI